jgi:ABC-type branched-subunit amino acid transport system ATPase component
VRALAERLPWRSRSESVLDDERDPELLVACKDLSVGYEHLQILFGVDLEVRRGQIVALLGSNGAGKTTLLRAVSGLVQPMAGTIWFDGEDVTAADAGAMAKRGVVQAPAGKDGIFPTLSVAENLRAAAWLYGYDEEKISAAITEVLDRFPRLAERASVMAGSLSGGEQQMLTLGMAMVSKPKLLMIDELSLGLAPVIVERLLEMVHAIHEQGTAVLLVEQSVNTALNVAHEAHFMEKGEIMFSGAARDLLRQDDVVKSLFMGGARESAPASPRRQPPPYDAANLVLRVEDVTKRFGGLTALNGVTFSLRPHEILGIIGPNGAGKTTLFDVISGFESVTTGQLLLGENDITGWSPDRRAWEGLGRSFQDSRIFASLTVQENLAIALERHLPVRDHLGSLLHLPDSMDVEDDVAWTVADLIDLMNLGHIADKRAADLSTGTRRIVDLAMAIAHEPTVLLLDEPSSGIAQRETSALGELLLRIRQEVGCSLVVIEHDMSVITAISDRMLALELGAVIAEGTPAEVTTDERVVTSYLGGTLVDAAAPAPRRRRPVRAKREPATTK